MARFDEKWLHTGKDRRRYAGLTKTFLTLVPLVSILVLVALIAGLVVLVNRDSRARQNGSLTTDAAWVEQTLRFQLSVLEDAVARTAYELARPSIEISTIEQRLRFFREGNPETLAILAFDVSGQTTLSVPESAVNPKNDAGWMPYLTDLKLGSRPVFSTPRTGADGKTVVDLVTQIEDRHGYVVATVSLSDMLARQIPSWIAGTYAVQLVDNSGNVLAEKIGGSRPQSDLQRVSALAPQLEGVSVVVAPYQVGYGLSELLVPSAAVAAAVLAIVSLGMLQRYANAMAKTERSLASEIALRHSMEDSLTVGLRAKDLDGRIFYVNAAFCEMVGYSPSEIVGKRPPMPYWVEDIHTETMKRAKRSEQNPPTPQTFDTRFRRPDGTQIEVQIMEAPLIDANGQQSGWMGSVIDITEQKRAAEILRLQGEALQRSGRLVTLGEMASTIAHELNQPLSAVTSFATGSLNLIESGTATPEDLKPALQKLSEQAERAGLIIRRIQDLARKRDPKFGDVQLADAVTSTCKVLEGAARQSRVSIQLALDTSLPPISADRILIEQVLVNLVRNAFEAMEGCPDNTPRILSIASSAAEGGQMIRLADTGPGISPGIRANLFEPFNSTKREGMGIGLNICRSIIELHHGRLTCADGSEGGAVFVIFLPNRGADLAPDMG